MPYLNKKLLLVSVSAGSGHVRAAEAIKKTAVKNYPELTVDHIDMMNYVSRPMRAAILDAYELMAVQLPELWRFVYKKTNAPTQSRAIRELTRILNLTNAGKFFRFLAAYKPDHIMATHFLPAHALINAPKKFALNSIPSLLMTDYDKHGLLMSPGMSHYFVSTKKMRWKMRQAGIADEKITVSGIPIDPVFYENKSVSALKKQYHATDEKKIALVLSGGQGLAKLHDIIITLAESIQPLIIFAVAGKNESLKNKLSALRVPPRHALHIIGWTDSIDDYIRIADCVITKPGGLSTTECIVLGKPIISISPIPGQEEHNAEYILENGFGVVAHAPDDLLYYLEQPTESLAPGYARQKKQTERPAEIILKTILRGTPTFA